MKKVLYLSILIFLTNCSNNQKDNLSRKTTVNEIQVKVNPNIETLGIILNLSELGDFVLEQSHENNNYAFVRLVRKHFENFKNHQAVTNFNELNKLDLAHFSHYYYGLNFSELPEFNMVHPRYNEFYSNAKFSKKEVDSILAKFDRSIKMFYKDAEVEKFLIENNKMYKIVVSEVKSGLPKDLLPVMEAYFKNYNNKYTIIPSISIPVNWGFGVDLELNKNKVYNYITGPYHDLKMNFNEFSEISNTDSLGFSDKKEILDLAIHEFGHSFVRFLDKKENVTLIKSLSSLNNEQLKKNFERMGESSAWETVFEEHLVRANEIMIWREMGNENKANEKILNEYNNEGLLYINEFVTLLEKYRVNKGSYNSFELFFPRLIEGLKTVKK